MAMSGRTGPSPSAMPLKNDVFAERPEVAGQGCPGATAGRWRGLRNTDGMAPTVPDRQTSSLGQACSYVEGMTSVCWADVAEVPTGTEVGRGSWVCFGGVHAPTDIVVAASTKQTSRCFSFSPSGTPTGY